MKTYCFDMDGVICKIDNEEYRHRSPIKETIDLMRKLNERNIVIINTGRHIDKLIETKLWLDKNGVKYDHIQFGKPVADVYIDDKALRFDGEWTEQCLQQLP